MNKLAIFVEGQTEQIFAEKLIREIAGRQGVYIEQRLAVGGRGSDRRWLLLDSPSVQEGNEYFVLIVNCGADNRVKSDIRDNYENLVKKDYQAIIGLRDAYPDARSRSDIPKLRVGLRHGLKTTPVEVLFVLGVMEIEAWFIAEHTHFARMSNSLTIELIVNNIGFDPSTDDIEQRPHPARDLRDIYSLVALTYDKHRTTVQKTIRVLDYTIIYLELAQRILDLRNLTAEIDRFLSAGSSAGRNQSLDTN